VGYQAEGRLSQAARRVEGIPVRRNRGKTSVIHMEMEVRTIEGLSGHSDRNQLLSYMQGWLQAGADIVTTVSRQDHGHGQDLHRFSALDARAKESGSDKAA